MEGTEYAHEAAREQGLPMATIGHATADLPAIDDPALGHALGAFLTSNEIISPPRHGFHPRFPSRIPSKARMSSRIYSTTLHSKTLSEVFEVIISDGCESALDDTIRHDEYAFKIRIVRQQRAGSAVCKNLGTRTARGRWVVFYEPNAMPAPSAIRQHLVAQISTPKPML